MLQYANSTLDMILSRKPDELIGAFMLALGLSFAAAKCFTRMRREAAEGLASLVGLILLVSLTSFALAAGYIAESQRRGPLSPIRNGARPPDIPMAGNFGSGPGPSIGPVMFRLLDSDNDGRVSPKDASVSIERFLRDSGRGGQTELDLDGMIMAVNQRIAIGTGAVVGSMAPPAMPFPMTPGPPPPSSPEVLSHLIAENTAGLIFESADTDRDGSLSPAEAGNAAASFIRAIEAERGKPLDLAALRANLRKNLQPTRPAAPVAAPTASRRAIADDPSPP